MKGGMGLMNVVYRAVVGWCTERGVFVVMQSLASATLLAWLWFFVLSTQLFASLFYRYFLQETLNTLVVHPRDTHCYEKNEKIV